jgi:hypothetical protein
LKSRCEFLLHHEAICLGYGFSFFLVFVCNFIVVHMNYQLLDFIMFCLFCCLFYASLPPYQLQLLICRIRQEHGWKMIDNFFTLLEIRLSQKHRICFLSLNELSRALQPISDIDVLMGSDVSYCSIFFSILFLQLNMSRASNLTPRRLAWHIDFQCMILCSRSCYRKCNVNRNRW